MDRREIKYLISYEQSLVLQNQLSRLLSLDPFSQNGFYQVRSLYFDSLENIDFHEKLDGVEKHKKIRLRIYERNANIIKLELKSKNGPYQKKQTLLLSKEEAKAIQNRDYTVLLERSEEFARQLYLIMTLGAYRPAVIVEYDRRAYVHPDFNTRITLDENVRTCSTSYGLFTDDLPLLEVSSNEVVLEVKYTDILVGSVQMLLEQYRPFQVSVSKYALSRGGN